MAYKLTQNDVADLTMLTNFTEELYDTYESLYKLELEGQKDSEEYKNKIERIIDIVNIADNIASRLILTREQFSAVLSYLYQKSGITTSDNTFILISQVNIPKPYLILGRIINRIIDAYFKKKT